MPFLRAAGHRLEYRWIPPARAGAATLVFLHEGLGSAALWGEFPDRLAARTGSGALVYSRYGFGRSDPLAQQRTRNYLHDEALEALPAVLADRRIERPVLVGHSDGATIALIYAALAGAPVRGLVLEAAHVFVEDATIRGIERARAAYAAGTLRERLAPHHADVDATFRGWADVWLASEFREWNIEDVLPRVRCPALVIQGEDDQYGTIAQVEAIRDGVSGPVELMLIHGSGHAPHVDRAGLVLDATARFIARLEGSA
ncbi:MAG TPA: alpha/beta hydrolase [Gemmatimonadales bacterium]|nr:alpha/beta hydrolase [Gemmatimonadales bacterium]